MTSAATEKEDDDSSHGKGATAGAEGTAALHSRDSNGAGIASADANEDTEAIAGIKHRPRLTGMTALGICRANW